MIFVGVGHGQKSNGRYDPGAVNPEDGQQEHRAAHVVVDAIQSALGRSRVPFYAEADSGVGHDPDFTGSARKANELDADLAVEVHFDSWTAPEGGFGIYLSGQGKRYADLITARYAANNLPTRSSYKDRRGLGFLRGTNMPAVIFECGPVKAYPSWVLNLMGECIGAAACDWFDVPYAPQGQPSTSPTPQEVVSTMNKPPVDILPTPTGEGYWVIAEDGGVFSYGDARFLGSLGHIQLNSPVIAAAARPQGDGYWMLAEDGGVFAHGAAGYHGGPNDT